MRRHETLQNEASLQHMRVPLRDSEGGASNCSQPVAGARASRACVKCLGVPVARKEQSATASPGTCPHCSGDESLPEALVRASAPRLLIKAKYRPSFAYPGASAEAPKGAPAYWSPCTEFRIP